MGCHRLRFLGGLSLVPAWYEKIAIVIPAARLQATVDLLEAVVSSPRPADGTASEFFRARRYIGSKDRRFIADDVWSLLRTWARIGWWIRRLHSQLGLPGEAPEWGDVPPRLRVLAHRVLVAGYSLSDLDLLCSGDKFCPHRLREREKALIRALRGQRLTHSDQPDWVQGEVPEWIIPDLAACYGDRVMSLLEALNREAPVDIRVNSLKADVAEGIARLESEGITVRPGLLSPLSLRLEGRANLPATDTFREGLVEVQDEGSQLVGLLVDARPGMAVVDFCAGAGGKTLAMAAGMQNKGRLIACDVSQGRLERSAVRLRRAGVHNVTRHVLSGERDKWVKRSAGRFDRVLIDAPCSGTGTWRRNPDARWRLDRQSVQALDELQGHVLDSASRLVRPGGRVVYATCSLLPQENEARIERFLASSPDFRVLDVRTLWSDLVGTAPCPATGPFLRLDPLEHDTDGFFVAVLERVEPSGA